MNSTSDNSNKAAAGDGKAQSTNTIGLGGREPRVDIEKQIAEKLGLSHHTVNNQLRSIYDKLHVHTRGGAVAKALKERLLGNQ